MSKVIFIIGRQRSGTTVLRELFAKYGALNADEVFHGDLTPPYRFYSFLAKKVAEDPKFLTPTKHGWIFRQFLDDLKEQAAGAPIVIDMKYFALNLIPVEGDLVQRKPFMIRFLERNRPPVIHLIRRNKLRVYVSEMIAVNTGVWSAYDKDGVPQDKPRLTLDPLKTYLALRNLDLDDRAVRELLANVPGKRELTYESMFRANGDFTKPVVNMVGNILGIKDIDPTPSQARMNPESLSDLIENFEDVKTFLERTEYAWMCKPEQ